MSAAAKDESSTTRSSTAGTLYVVATPIGNLRDVSQRAQEILRTADVVAAEDTRHTGALLNALGITARSLLALHEHNERARRERLLDELRAGRSVALVSDAGTPLISDPGFDLVRAAGDAQLDVVAVPGPCAAIAALSIAGLPTDRFIFEGFLPAKAQARRERLALVQRESRTLVFYEAPHRLSEVLDDMRAMLGGERRAVIARELTKLHESVYRGTLEDLHALAISDADMSRGEIVIVVAGAITERASQQDVERMLRVLLEELSPAQAAKLTARLTGARRSELYDLAMKWASDR